MHIARNYLNLKNRRHCSLPNSRLEFERFFNTILSYFSIDISESQVVEGGGHNSAWATISL